MTSSRERTVARAEALVNNVARVTADRETLANARLWLAFASMLFVSGITNVFPVFFPALLAEFGGSRGATAATISLCWIGGAVLGPLAGFLVARGNPRAVATVGLVAAAAGMLLGTAAPTLTTFVLAVGIGAGIGVGLTGIATQASLLADVYHRRRGVAMGIAFSGSMAAYAIAPLVHAVIERAGWRPALGIYGVAVCVLVPLAWRILPTRLESASAAGAPRAGDAGPSVREILVSPPFAMLFLAFTTPPMFGYLATTQHAIYFSARGLSAEEASIMLAVGGVLSASGRMLAGVAADRLGAPATGFLSFSLSLTGMTCLFAFEAWPVRALAYAYVLFLFLPLGSRATIFSVLVSRITPPAHYGVIFGILGIGNNLGAAAGPWLSGVLYDRTGSYVPIYLSAAGVGLVGLATLTAFVAMTGGMRRQR
jgi:predicted MFS family arabinose efflux permease